MSKLMQAAVMLNHNELIMAAPKNKQCIKMNSLFSKPLGGPIGQIEGAFGGLLMPLVYIAITVLAVFGVFEIIRSKDASITFKVIGLVALLPIIVILIPLVVRSVVMVLNANC